MVVGWRKEWGRCHVCCCWCVVGPSHGPRVIMALIAEDQRASARVLHVKYGASLQGDIYVVLGEVGGGR